MTPAVTLEDVARLLDKPTAEEVADLLRSHGVKGWRGSTCECPVARFVQLLTGDPDGGAGQALWKRDAKGHWECWPAPPAAVEFEDRFDDQDPAFADLVAP